MPQSSVLHLSVPPCLQFHPHLSLPHLPPQALVPLTALKELVLCVEAPPPPPHEHDEEENAAAAVAAAAASAAGGGDAFPAAALDVSATASAAMDEAEGPSTLVSSTVPSAGGGGGGDGHSPWSRCMEHTSGMRGLEVRRSNRGEGVQGEKRTKLN